MKAKLLILGLFCWSASFGQVPNHDHFTIGHVMFAVYGDSAVGRNTATVFADSDAAKFYATYGSKTMSPQTINGFRNYGYATAPTVTTTAISAITGTTATSGGNVTADGGASVTARGVCWNTSTNPTTANSHTSNGTGTGSFSSSLTSLTVSTTYYVRAYATNSVGTSYGSNVSFTTAACTRPSGLTDYLLYYAYTYGTYNGNPISHYVTDNSTACTAVNDSGDVGFTWLTPIEMEASSITTGVAAYSGHTSTDCVKVDDGWYVVSLDGAFSYVGIVQITSGIMTIYDCYY